MSSDTSRESFAGAALEALRAARTVRIETQDAAGTAHRATIWVVVDAADRVLVRSWRGSGARWFREAIAGGPVALHVGRERWPVHVERANDPGSIASCSAELERKYAGDPSTPSMVRGEILDTTLELLPA